MYGLGRRGALGLKMRHSFGTYMRFHDLRHTFGTIAVRIPDVTLPDVQAMMGHANITTTMRYVHYRPRTAEAARFTEYLRAAIADADEDAQVNEVNAARSTAGPPSGDGEEVENDLGGSVEPDEECRRRDSNPRHADYDSAALTS